MTEPAQLFSKQAEDALLGSILISPEQLHTLTVRPDEFFIQRNRSVWEAFLATIKAGREIDIITVNEQLTQKEGTDSSAYLTGLITQSPNSYNAEHYAEIVSDYARRRADVKIANMLAQGAYANGEMDRAKIIEMLTTNTDVSKGAVGIASLLNDFYTGVEERAKHPADVWGISTGLTSLDKATGGLQAQQATIIAGSPGIGKTTILLQILLHAAMHGHEVAIYELEMNAEQLLSKLVNMLTSIPTRDMNSGRMTPHWDAFATGIERLEKLPMHICDDPVMNTAQVRADVARIKSTQGCELIGLDYLNLLTDREGDDKNENTTAKAVRFRQICREFKVAGISVQSVNKEGMRAVVPTLADMSGPAEVGFTPDNVFFLVGDQNNEENFTLLPAKMRYSDVGRKPIPLRRPKGKMLFGEPEKGMY